MRHARFPGFVRRSAAPLLAAAGLAVLALAGCATTAPTERPVQKLTAERAPGLDIPWPAQTVAAVRLDPQGVNSLTTRARAVMGMDLGELNGQDYMERLLAAALVDDESIDETFALNWDGEFALEGLADAPAYVALSLHGHAEFLRAARLKLPPIEPADAWFPRGIPARVVLPATSAKAAKTLAQSVRDACELKADDPACPGVRAVESRRTFAVVDVNLGATSKSESVSAPASNSGSNSGSSAGSSSEAKTASESDSKDAATAAKALPDASGLPFERKTPALRRFLTGDAPVAMYTRSAAIAQLAALARGVSIRDALADIGGPWRREAIRRGMEMLWKTQSVSDPGARQFEDLTVGFALHEGALDAQLVQTYTGRGRAISQAARSGPKLAVPRAPAFPLTAAWRYNARAAAEHVAAPQWLSANTNGKARRAGELAEVIRTGRGWTWAMALAEYPDALAAYPSRLLDRALSEQTGAFFGDDAALPDALFADSGLPVAGAVGLGAPAERRSSMELTAWAELAFPGEAADALKPTVEALFPAEEASVPISVQTATGETPAGEPASSLSFELGEQPGEADSSKHGLPEDATLHVLLDAGRLALPEGLTLAEIVEDAPGGRVFEKFQTFEMVMREGEEARTLHLRAGGEATPKPQWAPRAELEPLEVEATNTTIRDVSDRLAALWSAERTAFDAGATEPLTKLAENIDVAADTVAKGRPQVLADLAALRSRTLLLRAHRLERAGKLRAALEGYQRVCSSEEAQTACAEAERLRLVVEVFQWTDAQYAGAPAAMDAARVYLTERGLLREGKWVLERKQLESLLLDGNDGNGQLAALDEALTVSKNGDWAVQFAPAPHVSGRLAAALAQRAHQQRPPNNFYRLAQMMGTTGPPKGTQSVRLMVRRPGVEPPIRAYLLEPPTYGALKSPFDAETPEKSESDPNIPDRFVEIERKSRDQTHGRRLVTVTLVLTPRGIAARAAGVWLDPAEGCESDGEREQDDSAEGQPPEPPTVCLSEDDAAKLAELDEQRRTALEAGDAEKADRKLAAMRQLWPTQALRDRLENSEFLKRAGDWTDTVIVVGGANSSEDLPFGIVAETLDAVGAAAPNGRMRLRGIGR